MAFKQLTHFAMKEHGRVFWLLEMAVERGRALQAERPAGPSRAFRGPGLLVAALVGLPIESLTTEAIF